MACCCGPAGVCGCADSIAFPESFNVHFEDFSFSVAQTLAGTAPSPSVLKNFIEGLSPIYFPRLVQPSSAATYSRTRCNNTGPCGNTCPPDFAAIFPGSSSISTLSFGVRCNGDIVVPSYGFVAWRWYIFMPFSCWTTHSVEIKLKLNATIYSAGNACNNIIPEFSVPVVSSLSDNTQSGATDYPALSNSAFYNATGTARFVPKYANPLP